jgi:hypothetical protein
MSDERAISFVDTNVLVYALENRNSPGKSVAQRLLSGGALLERGGRGRAGGPGGVPLVVVDYSAIRAAVGCPRISWFCTGHAN